MSLFFDNEQLEHKQKTKFQGVYIHENLCRKSHINFICHKVAKSVGIIYRSFIYQQ